MAKTGRWRPTSRDARFARAEQLIYRLGKPELGTGQLYKRINPILIREFRRPGATSGGGIRKQDFLPFARKVQAEVRLITPIPRRDAPRLKTEAPQIRKAMGSVRSVRSPRFRHYYYVDIKFKHNVGTKGGMVVRYMTIFLGAFTPIEFKKAVSSRQINRIIATEVYEKVGELVPYEVLGFWISKTRKEVS